MIDDAEPGDGPSVRHLVALAFAAPDPAGGGRDPDVVAEHDANGARGVFSRVVRAELSWPSPGPDQPLSVVVKTPAAGPNGAAGAAMGACRREAVAYTRVLPTSPVDAPRPWLIHHGPGRAASFVLDDLGHLRAVDQLDGLGADDCLAVADALGRFHHHWRSPQLQLGLPVRRSTPSAIPPAALEAGLRVIDERFSATLTSDQRQAFARLVARRAELVDAFAGAGPHTLCHGDPRADNLVFAPDGSPVLFDWQQLAIQFGAADVAWLAATSLRPDTRRVLDGRLAAATGANLDDYRLGLVLPGLAVLLLAQRETPEDRSARFVATSLDRIATALVDLDVASIRVGNPRA